MPSPELMLSPEITTSLLKGLRRSGPTDPIELYERPIVGRLFRERINQGLRMLGTRRYSRAIEIGYGAGATLLAIAGSVDELHGIDLDSDPGGLRAMLGEQGRAAELIRGSVFALPYQPAEFDLVVCFSVFEHLRDYEQGLAEVVRILKPGGLFLLGMPAVHRLMEAGFRAIGFRRIRDHHVTTPQTLRQAFGSFDLRVKDESRLRLIPGLPVYFSWLLEKAGG